MAAHRHGRRAELTAEEPFPGVYRRRLDSERATVASYSFAPGARFPLHRHPEEQITIVEEGEVELRAGGTRAVLGAGDWSIAAPGLEHGLVAGPAGARILIVLVPRRTGDVTLVGGHS